jgi:hypothetical protein
MAELPDSPLRANEPVERVRIDEADLALVLASVAWAGLGSPLASLPNDHAVSGPAGARQWHRLERSWAERLRALSGGRCTVPSQPATAQERLRHMHAASMRVDLNRVHPSWCVRALQEESPAVRRVVAASVPDSLRDCLRRGLLLEAHDLTGERLADPDVLSWALVFWAERLVGGDPSRALDPPVIAILTQYRARVGYAVCRLAGAIKLELVGRQPPLERPGPTWAARKKWIEDSATGTDPQFFEQVSRDLQSKSLAKVPARHRAARIGAQTLARLLADCEPFRVRWALQHVPYPIAKLVRSLMPPSGSRPAFISQGETRVLQTAWDRLKLEGRVPAHPGDPSN